MKRPKPTKLATLPKSNPKSKQHTPAADAPRVPAIFPVVGIGASAGGLEASSELFAHLPVQTGMADVLVQHLDPHHTSALPELLSRKTSIPVTEVTDRAVIEPDHAYVIP